MAAVERDGSTYISRLVGLSEIIGAVRPPSGLTDWRMSRASRSIAVRPVDCARACDSLVRAESMPEKKNANRPRAKIDESAMPISSSISVKPR